MCKGNERVVRKRVERRKIMGALKKGRVEKQLVWIVCSGNIERRCVNIIVRLLRNVTRCIEADVVAEDWKVICIVLAYKGRDNRNKCENYRGIDILSIPGNMHRC